MGERQARVGLWLSVTLCLALLSWRAGATPLFDPDESRFARTSVEMVRSGDLVVPQFEGQPRLVKPPMLHWIQAALFRTFGAGERVARLPSLLATLGSMLLVAWIARRRFGHEGAFWAAAILGTMPIVFVVGRLGTLDALLSLHVLAVVALDLAERDDTGSQRGLAAGCLTGLAFLIKGPVGVVLPLLIVLAGRTAAGREILPRPRAALLAVAGWLAVVLPWGLAFVERVGAGAAAAIVRGEALDRFFAGTDHVEPPWFFAAVVAVGFFPWIGPLVVALPRALFQRDDPAARTALYAAAGLIVGLLFFSIGKSKLASYAVPLAPLAAILAAWELGQELRAPRERTLAPTVLVALLAAAAVALLIARDVGLPAEAASFAPAGAAVLGVGSLAAMAGLLLRRPRIVWGAAALASTTLLVAATALLLPAIASRRSARALIDGVPALASTERSLVVVDMRVPSLTYYLDRVPELVPMERLAERIRNGDRPLFVFDEGDLTHAPAAVERLERVGAHGKYVVLREEPSPRVPLDASAPDG